MATSTVRKVITRGTRKKITENEFRFTKEMIPFQNGGVESFVDSIRQQSWEAFRELPMPNTKMEAWRRTNIQRLDVASFELSMGGGSKNLPGVPAALLEPLIGDGHGGQIVSDPGGSLVELSEELASKGLVFTSLKTAERDHPKLLAKIIGQLVKYDESKFSALISAFAEDGVFLYVPKGLIVDEPLHSVQWTPGRGNAYLSRIMVYVDDGASVTYVHESASPTETEGQTLNGSIVEVFVGENANLRFVELQSLGGHVWNFTHERMCVSRNGKADWIFGAMGSNVTKNFSDLDLEGEGAEGRMSGFYFTNKTQHLDHDTQQNHLAPHTTSDLLFKGALRDDSRSVWQGMIYVAPGAQQTDGYQANRNLLLDKLARADSIPGLEILADDVRCTHGATVGKIDPNLVFYLESRGIPTPEAERLIVEGFFDPIMQRIPYDGVRNRFKQAILDKMS